MILPQGGIWQEIRASVLDTIQPRTPITPRAPYSLSEWQAGGFYTCSRTTPSEIELLTSTDDFGAALLGDAEHLFDHAAEQKATALHLIHLTDWPSSTWLLVTLYYWAYFAALATSRMWGRTTWFLGGAETAHFAALASLDQGPRPGAYILTVGARVSASDRVISLKVSRHRLHEAMWSAFFGNVEQAVARAVSPKGNALEYEFYHVLLKAKAILGHDWPSAVRNAVNYRPGVAYDAVRGEDSLAYKSLIHPPSQRPLQAAVDMHRQALVGLKRNTQVIDAPAAFARLLVSFAFLVDSLASDLYSDVVDRHSLSKEWLRLRKSYLTRHAAISNSATWPIG